MLIFFHTPHLSQPKPKTEPAFFNFPLNDFFKRATTDFGMTEIQTDILAVLRTQEAALLAVLETVRQCGVRLHLSLELLPACQGMLEAQVGDDLPLTIHDDDIMMVAGPVEAGVVSDFDPRFHAFAFGCAHRSAVGSHPDTGSLAGYCSLRHFDSRC
jgi:hypothetical protein